MIRTHIFGMILVEKYAMRMKRFNFIATIFLFSVLVGCQRPEEAPVFKGVENIKVSKVEGTKAFLNADAFFYNPNNVRMMLKKIDVDVEVEGKHVGTINQSTKIRIPAMKEFKIPLDATVNLGDQGVLNNLLGILGGKKMKVKYKGHIKVITHGFPVRVPVEYEDEVRFR